MTEGSFYSIFPCLNEKGPEFNLNSGAGPKVLNKPHFVYLQGVWISLKVS